MNSWTLLGLQNSNSPVCDLMVFFHDLALMVLLYIMIAILFIIMKMMFNKFINRYLLHGHLMEIIWTIMPMFILLYIAIPSIKILYLTDETLYNKLTLKTIGHQWYWSYEYSDFNNLNFDSFMIPSSQLNPNEFRLLDVDNRCVLPFKYPLRILTTSMDVIHAWTLPSLGIKMDSTPGRLNQVSTIIHRPGVYYGQCSEICGMNHSFMPIVIESTNFINFKNWLIYMIKSI